MYIFVLFLVEILPFKDFIILSITVPLSEHLGRFDRSGPVSPHR